MAFGGSPFVKQISDSQVQFSGATLAAGASGVIGLDAATGTPPGIRLPEGFKPAPYKYGGVTVTPDESIDVLVQCAATGVATAIPLAIVMTGQTPEDWRCTITNTHGSLATPALLISIRFHQ